MKKIILTVFFIIAVPSICIARDGTWPTLKEFDDEFLAYSGGKPVEFVKPLYDLQGAVRYRLVCRGGSTEYMDKLSGEININYVSPLTCILNDGDKETESSLLAEDESPPWHTRGQYRLSDLIGACASYPEYGLLRHFRLRRFELTFFVTDLKLNKQGQPGQFKLRVSLRQKDKSKSKTAEQPGYLSPHGKGRSCSKVEKGNDVRMCRDWSKGGSWVPCKD